MLSQLDGPEYIERVAVNNVKNVKNAKKAIEKAFRNQVENPYGEVCVTCPGRDVGAIWPPVMP